MIKTTRKEILNNAEFTDLKELKSFINKNNYKIINIEKIAYCESIYGCGGYLLHLTTSSGLVLTAFTNRSTWMYNCTSLAQYND